jgi:hypothetical protein
MHAIISIMESQLHIDLHHDVSYTADHEQEQDLHDALVIFGVSFVARLGTGGSAIVYQVLSNHGVHYALKIVPRQGTKQTHFEKEISWLLWQKCQGNLQNISQLEASAYLPSGSLAALLSPVGEQIRDPRTSLPDICRALSRLHRAGWRHGDARIPNFVQCGQTNTVIVIDFGYILHCPRDHDIAYQVPFEMYRIAASFLQLKDDWDLDQDGETLISQQTGHLDTIRDAVQEYVDRQYTEEAAVEFAETLLML